VSDDMSMSDTFKTLGLHVPAQTTSNVDLVKRERDLAVEKIAEKLESVKLQIDRQFNHLESQLNQKLADVGMNVMSAEMENLKMFMQNINVNVYSGPQYYSKINGLYDFTPMSDDIIYLKKTVNILARVILKYHGQGTGY